MQDELFRFTEYYKKKHSGRTLTWDHSLGTATLKARFKSSMKELSVSLHQAVVLLLFNSEDEISFQDIKQRVLFLDNKTSAEDKAQAAAGRLLFVWVRERHSTNVDSTEAIAELKLTLQSLACGKKKVLKKLPPGRDVNDDDSFRFNADFEDPRARIHINTIQAKVSAEESVKTNQSIEDDRKSALDAAIVRIMKAKKELMYEELKVATIDAIKNHFVPSVDFIKRRIDGLVEQEYLKRDEEVSNKFIYLA